MQRPLSFAPFVLGLALLVSLPVVSNSSANAAEAGKPNIILIMADDMGYECVTANGGESYKTPNLDKLAATGMRFEHCYSQPICTPSRVQIMTGMYNSRNYVRFGLLQPGSTTFGNLFRDDGYATCVVGKWQLDGGFQGPGGFGFDDYCLWQLTRRPNRYANPGLEINREEIDFRDGQYGPDIVSDHACSFIRQRAEADKPFFLYYPMILPHWPFEPTPDSAEWDPTFRRDDKKEISNKGTDNKYFADMVTYTDKMVGKIVAQLDEAGVRDNTLILFTGDNGTYSAITSRFQGRDWKGGKGHMMDNGTHVTLIANMPGTVPAGAVNLDLVDFSDILPTLCQMADISVPRSLALDGHSFAPQLRGEPNPNPRPYVYCWYFRNGKPVLNSKQHSAGESARTKQYKLYLDGGFYDVTQDFYETEPLNESELTDEQRAKQKMLGETITRFTREGFYEQSSKEPKSRKKSKKKSNKKKKEAESA